MTGQNISRASQVISLVGGLDVVIRGGGSPSAQMTPETGERRSEGLSLKVFVLSRILCNIFYTFYKLITYWI